MLYLLAAALILALALLVLAERTIRRERADAAEMLAEWRRHITEERAAAAAERKELYQRIQAPDTAVTEHVQASRPDRRRPRPIAADDDAAFLAREEGKRG